MFIYRNIEAFQDWRIVIIYIDMVVTIMSYKFSTLKREEVIQMLDITISEVRAFQDAKNEGLTEGRAEGQLAARREMLLELLQEELGGLSKESQTMVVALSIDQLKQLSATRKNFKSEQELQNWLKKVEQ
jgi:predicted transposase YdaD